MYLLVKLFHSCAQANILSGRYSLSLVEGEELTVSLLERMLAHEPADRPPTAAILKHPVFWSKVSCWSGCWPMSRRTGRPPPPYLNIQSSGAR